MEQRCCALPALPPLGTPQARSMGGPTPFSNWVIPGQVVAGAYPASMDDTETERMLTLLLELGINTFVCLQAEVNIHIPDHSWRSGMGLRPYIRDAQKILSKAHQCGSTSIKQRKIDFLHLPIIDGSVTTDNAMSRLAEDCCERVLRGEKLYIHCWGGHGRTGTLVATMLGRLYDLPYSSALRYTQAYHDTRVYPQGVRSPQTAVQRAQVRRLLLIPSNISAMVASKALDSATSSNISPVRTNIPLSSSGRNAVQEPVTPTRAVTAAAALQGGSTLTPKQLGLQVSVRRQLSYPSSAASPAAAGRSPITSATAADISSSQQSSSRMRSSSLNQSLPSAFRSTTAATGTGSPTVVSSRQSPVPGAAATRIAALVTSSVDLQQQQQQRVISGAAPGATIGLSPPTGLFRTGLPRTPVQQRLSRSLLQRSLEVPT